MKYDNKRQKLCFKTTNDRMVGISYLLVAGVGGHLDLLTIVSLSPSPAVHRTRKCFLYRTDQFGDFKNMEKFNAWFVSQVSETT